MTEQQTNTANASSWSRRDATARVVYVLAVSIVTAFVLDGEVSTVRLIVGAAAGVVALATAAIVTK
jgi:ABC-type microcin C transport system permease subunit YejE